MSFFNLSNTFGKVSRFVLKLITSSFVNCSNSFGKVFNLYKFNDMFSKFFNLPISFDKFSISNDSIDNFLSFSRDHIFVGIFFKYEHFICNSSRFVILPISFEMFIISSPFMTNFLSFLRFPISFGIDVITSLSIINSFRFFKFFNIIFNSIGKSYFVICKTRKDFSSPRTLKSTQALVRIGGL